MTLLDFNEPFIIPRTNVAEDQRGFFEEYKFPEGFSFSTKQTFESYGKETVVKGLHLNYDMSKMVKVVNGCIIDIAVDFRYKNKPLKVYEFELWPETGWLYIPPGFGHGIIYKFAGKTEYLLSQHYQPENCITINIFDKDIPYPNNGLVQLYCLYHYDFLMSNKDWEGISVQRWLSQ